jgi:hypothetical protein
LVLLRIDKNAHKQLNIKITKQTPVISSIKEVSVSLKNLSDVNTKKQNPRKFEEEFNICGDLFGLSSIEKNYEENKYCKFSKTFSSIS